MEDTEGKEDSLQARDFRFMDYLKGTITGLDEVLLGRFLKKHFNDSKPTDVLSVNVNWAVPKGSNYGSLVYRVKLTCLLASGRRKTFSVIFKKQFQSGGNKELYTKIPVFRTEIKMYTTVLRLMEDLQDEFGDKRESLWAHMYGYEPYSSVAFEDLTNLNYEVTDRKILLDLAHSLLVLRNIARFHAMSKVLLQRNLISREDGGKLTVATDEGIGGSWLKATLICASISIQKAWGNDWSEIAAKLRQQIPFAFGKGSAAAKYFDPRFEILNHGDLWSSNIMFQYTEFERVPISLRFVDFQMCHYNSFIWDLAHFINASVEPTVRRTMKDRLFEAYQQSLEKNLKFFQYPGYIPTLEDVKSEDKRMEYVQALMLVSSPVTYAETSHAMATDKIMGGAPEEVIHPSVYEDGKAQAAMGEDLKEFVAKGLF